MTQPSKPFDHPISRGFWASLAPQNCLICGDFFLGFGVCEICFLYLKPRVPPLCSGCGLKMNSECETNRCLKCSLNSPTIGELHTEYDFESIGGKLLRAAKLRRQPRLLSTLLKHTRPKLIERLCEFDHVIPIPDRYDRLKCRGFSPSRMIAKAIIHRRGKRLSDGYLYWRRKVKSQQGLTRAQRLMNMRSAFGARSVNQMRILLIDDVYTTGQTVNWAAHALKKAGAKAVCAFVLTYRNELIRLRR